MAATHSKTSAAKSASIDTLKSGFTEEDLRQWQTHVREVSNLTPVDEVPKGWYTVAELSKQLHTSLGHMYKLIGVMLDTGTVEVATYTTYRQHRNYPSKYYRLKK